MSIDPTRGGRSPAARPRTEAPAASRGDAAAGPSGASTSRTFDERLGARAPAPAARGRSSAARPRAPAPVARHAGAPAAEPARAQTPELTRARVVRLNDALLAYNDRQRAAGQAGGPTASRAADEVAFRQADELVQLVDGLKGTLHTWVRAQNVPKSAYDMRLMIGSKLARSLPEDKTVHLAITEGHIQGLPEDMMQALLDDGFALEDRKSEEARRYLPVMRAGLERYGSPRGLGEHGALSRLRDAASGIAHALRAQLVAAETRVQYATYRLALLSPADGAFATALSPFRQLDLERMGELQEICDLHQDPRVPLRPAEKEWLAAHVEAVRGDAEAACLEGCRVAAAAVGGESNAVADTLLVFADSLRTMVATLEQMRDLPRLPTGVAQQIAGFTPLRRRTERPDVVAELEAAAAQAEAEAAARKAAAKAAAPAAGAASSSRTKKGQRRQAPARAAAAGAAAPAARPVTHQLAHERLRQFPRPIEPPPGGPLDFVALGTALGRDTAVLRLFNERTDPMVIADAQRRSVSHWFGDPAAWERMHRQVAADASDPAAQAALLDEIDQRRQAIGTLLARIGAQELDQVKGHARPEEAHVRLLFEAGQLEVSPTLRVLRSDGDPDEAHGKVFELALQPKPTSSGALPPPIFLHLHTDRVIDAEACRKLPLAQLAAAHFKSAAQRGHGATWERLNGALGEVHRGHLATPALLKNLLRRPA